MRNIKETREVVSNTPRLIDVLSGDYNFHYVALRRLSQILTRGIFSTAFGQRIKDSRFTDLNENFSVWVMNDPREIFMTLPDFNRIVGLVIKAPNLSARRESLFSEIPIRVAPRKFLGLTIIDTLPIENKRGSLYRRVGDVLMGDPEIKDILENVEKAKQIAEAESINIPRLPIYGTSGSLYSPVRLNYGDLKQSLASK